MNKTQKMNQASIEELTQLLAKHRSKKRNLIIGCLVFTGVFVAANYLISGAESYNVVQGLFLAVGFVFVSFISETEKKIRTVRKLMRQD